MHRWSWRIIVVLERTGTSSGDLPLLCSCWLVPRCGVLEVQAARDQVLDWHGLQVPLPAETWLQSTDKTSHIEDVWRIYVQWSIKLLLIITDTAENRKVVFLMKSIFPLCVGVVFLVWEYLELFFWFEILLEYSSLFPGLGNIWRSGFGFLVMMDYVGGDL